MQHLWVHTIASLWFSVLWCKTLLWEFWSWLLLITSETAWLPLRALYLPHQCVTLCHDQTSADFVLNWVDVDVSVIMLYHLSGWLTHSVKNVNSWATCHAFPCWHTLPVSTSHYEDQSLVFGSITVTKLNKTTLKSSSVRVTHLSSADTLILLDCSVHLCDCSFSLSLSFTLSFSLPLCSLILSLFTNDSTSH